MDIYFQLLNPLVFGIFAIGFLCINALQPGRSARLFAASYLIGAAAFIADLIFQDSGDIFIRTGVAGLYATTAVLLVGGFWSHYQQSIPWRLLGAITVTHLGLYGYLLYIEASWLRSFSVNFGCGVIFFVGLLAFRHRLKRVTDKVLFAVHSASCVQCFARPIGVALLTPGPLSAETHNESLFMVSLHLFVGAAAVMTAMSVLIVLSRHVFDDLQNRSTRDPLTGLLNRRGFETHIEQLMRRPRQVLSVVVVDIDHFKQVNDGQGHAIGDKVIVAMADLIRRQSGAGIAAGRWGGEEFIILINDTDRQRAKDLAEHLRQQFAASPMAGRGGDFFCTASFGVAERREDEDLASLVGRADDALYLAKRQGRNSVRCEGDLSVETFVAFNRERPDSSMRAEVTPLLKAIARPQEAS